MFKKKEEVEPIECFQFHKGEKGGCVAREPVANGRIWVFQNLDDFLVWIKDNVQLKPQQ